MNIFDKVFGSKKPNTIEVSYGKGKYDIDFTEGSIEDGTITVGELRSQCTYITNTPGQNIRLLYRGKNLTNDTVKLSAVGMKSGSKVLCMASPSTAPPEQSVNNANGTSSELHNRQAAAVKSPSEQLDALMLVIRTELQPPVEAFTSHVPDDAKARKETHDRLAELLLQKLFALDGITCKEEASQAEKDEVRQKRKDGVKYTQALLDSVDEIVRQDTMEAERAAA
ncbi:BAG domain protein [Taphrina deformans PYCC 5710]|uniref:BAG domain protein n=1 Tax=Taphrina deformans (strain PYCC 5710 / ATCC 11124 / CBS 356.35 / IMI 108563 / JCM 9778 / NBRC 8474) TaxID=1097556 RepID=R4XIM4_TAPDE|nr:BAG domain protein [Taphrina deformans PYCC 5710]|eukprot:CCG83217.1 BAG domain protein [Taphrina deformans PYCC 5710]